ncbi:MAG: hypothetical protein AAF698_09580, partial [Pseudomonadota bacterium]
MTTASSATPGAGPGADPHAAVSHDTAADQAAAQAAERLAPYLQPGETLVWSGRPMLRPVLEGHDLILPILSLVLGVAIFEVLDLGAQGLPGDPLGLLFVVVMLALFAGAAWLPLRTFLRRRRSFYGVTNARALVLETGPGGGFRDYPLDWDRIVNIRFGERVSVIFEPSRGGPHGGEHGFEQLIDGLKVYKLIRRIQTGARWRP